MINRKLGKLYIFICFIVFYPNIKSAQDDSQESNSEKRLIMPEEFRNKNLNENLTKSDSLRMNKEDEKQKKDKEKKKPENPNQVNETVQLKNSRFSKFKATTFELSKKKKFLYGIVTIGTVALLIVSNKGEIKINDSANTLGPPPEWPNGP